MNASVITTYSIFFFISANNSKRCYHSYDKKCHTDYDVSYEVRYEKGPSINDVVLIRSGLAGKSLSEALLFAEHGENMLFTKIVLNVTNNFCTQHVLPNLELGIFMQ